MERLGLRSDGALAQRLKLVRAVLHDIRASLTPVSATIVLLLQ